VVAKEDLDLPLKLLQLILEVLGNAFGDVEHFLLKDFRLLANFSLSVHFHLPIYPMYDCYSLLCDSITPRSPFE
jgi:hypothetical protein